MIHGAGPHPSLPPASIGPTPGRTNRRPADLDPVAEPTSIPARFGAPIWPTIRRTIRAWGLGLAALGLAGCATFGPTPHRIPSTALADTGSTHLGRVLAAPERAHPGMSGFSLLADGLEALVARLALTDSAERTLDAQYYIYASDATGSLLLQHMIAAADRGVRVRLLLDDYNVSNDAELAALCAHRNIEVRVFNPLPIRARWARLPAYALTFGRTDRRMHNKLLIADNALAILGGRNVGDDYFNLESANSFRDFDVICAGPATRSASAAFDEYWNSAWAMPASAFVRHPPSLAKVGATMRRIGARAQEAAGFERQYQALRGHYLTGLIQDGATLVWAPGEIVSDPPASDRSTGGESVLARRLDQEWAHAQRAVLIEAAYFIPGRKGIATFRRLRERGVSVTMLTCALSATDVPLVYCAYEGYRRPLLQAGVDLYEYRLTPPTQPGAKRPWYRSGRSYDTLHSKVMVFDRRRIWIGSLNLDPRSAYLNTEIAAIIDSTVLADRLASDITADLAPDRSWKLSLDAKSRIAWSGTVDGVPTIRHHQPASWLRRLDTFLLSVFPRIEHEL